ncbi:ThuA domain-containing protein [Pullulanibacillus sp. KACC 23026]|uniref:ThuA domain-containing protein n=1 Tax=Pullulanibacillus sp. KACC 23026 TaxID=3028315 RepID=UPI0023B05E14|nr:ThuA domain-containing protein [Pullulanibacillus sp. KACC 23026]WEG12205.1 ThuA domain-containing protein [Pullulanibacillus sp. KACC 23026]
MVKVTVWNENIHEQTDAEVRDVYPEGIHGTIANFLKENGLEAKTATLEQPEHGLTDNVLNETDVLIWWGHTGHDKVDDRIVEKVKDRVLKGMGLIVLHSGHFSKIFKSLMGTTCDLKWREAGENERLWVVNPSHPIAEGIGEYIELDHEEMYGEHFDIPEPDELVFLSWFRGGEVFRSGCVFNRGLGKVFYFRPGHETFPTYHQDDIQRVIVNAVNYVKPLNQNQPIRGNVQPLERFDK